MITPDTKDWTWVLQRPCPECGFDASRLPATEVATLVRANASEWQRLGAAGLLRPGRPRADSWSSLEYACHVRDVYSLAYLRVCLMLTEDDPLFANWDQDATAVEDRYEEQDPATVVNQLVEAAQQAALRLDGVGGAEWPRAGRRSDGAAFTVDTLARYIIHDPIHHVWDVARLST